MSLLDSVLTKVENVLAAGSLAAAALLAILAIVLRTFFNEVIFWSEEAIIYLVICSTFVGAVVTLRHNQHVNVDIIAVFLKRRGQKVMAVIGTLVLLVYLGAVGWFGWLLLFEPQTRHTVTPAMHLPLWVVEMSLPIGFTLLFVRALEILVRTIRGVDPYPDAAGSIIEEEGGLPLSARDLGVAEDRQDGDAR